MDKQRVPLSLVSRSKREIMFPVHGLLEKGSGVKCRPSAVFDLQLSQLRFWRGFRLHSFIPPAWSELWRQMYRIIYEDALQQRLLFLLFTVTYVKAERHSTEIVPVFWLMHHRVFVYRLSSFFFSLSLCVCVSVCRGACHLRGLINNWMKYAL